MPSLPRMPDQSWRSIVPIPGHVPRGSFIATRWPRIPVSFRGPLFRESCCRELVLTPTDIAFIQPPERPSRCNCGIIHHIVNRCCLRTAPLGSCHSTSMNEARSTEQRNALPILTYIATGGTVRRTEHRTSGEMEINAKGSTRTTNTRSRERGPW